MFPRQQEGELLFFPIAVWESQSGRVFRTPILGRVRRAQKFSEYPDCPHTMVCILSRSLLCIHTRKRLKVARRREKTCVYLYPRIFTHIVSFNRSSVFLAVIIIPILQVRKLRCTDTRKQVGAEPGFESSQALALNHRTTLPPLFLQGPRTPSFSHSAHTRQSCLPGVPGPGMAAKEKMRTPDPRPQGLNLTQFKLKGLQRPGR